MDTALWVTQIAVAVAFAFTGFMKATKPKEQLAAKMPWVNEFSPTNIKLVGIVEVLGAIGLILPWALDILPVLTPLAAIGLAITMVGAAMVHVKRKEWPMVPVNVVLFALCLVIAVARFDHLS